MAVQTGARGARGAREKFGDTAGEQGERGNGVTLEISEERFARGAGETFAGPE